MKPIFLGLLMAAALLALGCHRQTAAEGTTGLSEEKHQDLLVGYSMLADTLSDESKLGKLDVVKTLMLDAPNDAISKLMEKLSDASKQRGDELSKLRRQAPDVSDKPTKESPVGDAIKEIAKDFGKDEMLSRKGGFDVRFVLVQAQATRMVAAMAKATARFDPNPERKAWLKELAAEYEGYRGDLIKYLGGQATTKE